MNSRSISGVAASAIDAGALSRVRSVAGPGASACGCGSVRDVASIGVCRGKDASDRNTGHHYRILQSRHRATCGVAHRTHHFQIRLLRLEAALYAEAAGRYVALQYMQMLHRARHQPATLRRRISPVGFAGSYRRQASTPQRTLDQRCSVVPQMRRATVHRAEGRMSALHSLRTWKEDGTSAQRQIT